jgi:hypothetical protein
MRAIRDLVPKKMLMELLTKSAKWNEFGWERELNKGWTDAGMRKQI